MHARPARRLTVAVATVLAAAALSGCATDADTPTVDPTDLATGTVTPPATEDPGQEVAPVPAPDDSPEPVVNGPNTLDQPRSGATVEGPAVTVGGEGTAFEGTLEYVVLDAGTGDVVDEGFTQAGANGEIAEYSFELDLEPGSYTVQVYEPDVSDGESADGPQRNLVEVTFTVV